MLLMTAASPWASWRPATCMPVNCFCEAVRDAWVRQPVNTITSLAFVVVALVVMRTAHSTAVRPEADTRILTSRVYLALYATALVLIGLGSAFYHASLTFVGQTSDVLGMYLLGTFVLLFALTRLVTVKPATAAAAYIVGNMVLLTALIYAPELRRYAFGAIILASLILEWIARRRGLSGGDVRWLLAAVGVFALAFAIWTADITGTVCSPQSWLQGHGAWHLLGAIASALVYRYYLSESRVVPLGSVSFRV